MRVSSVYVDIIDGYDETRDVISLKAVFENDTNIEGFPPLFAYRDKFIVNREDVFEKLSLIQEEHPYFMLESCESPIEITFFVVALSRITNIRPQVWVGEYRVDFAVPEKKVAIELDGHEWHKTKEQRTYDAKRDRQLLLQGWRTIRFTGSEIYHHLLGCVREAEDIINKLSTVQ